MLAWLAVALVAFGTRFINLDGNPLQPAESSLAMDSWQILRGQGVSVALSPLLTYANVLAFLTLGASDASARAIPALCGSLVALSPVLFRQYIGRFGALVAALALSVSPTVIFASRSVDPTALTLALGVGLLLAVLAYSATGRASFAYIGGILVPLLLVSGPSAVTLVIIAIGFIAAFGRSRLTRKYSDENSEQSRPAADTAPLWFHEDALAELSPGTLRRIGLIVVVEFAILATGLGTNLQGFGDSLAHPLGIWSDGFSHIDAQSIGLLPLVFLGYEPLIVGFGVAGAVQAFRRDRRLDQFLVWCAVVATLVVLVSDGTHPLWIGLAIVPLGLLAGHVAEDLWSTFAAAEPRRRLLLYGAVALPLLATTIIAAGNATLAEPNVPRLAFLGPLLAIAAFSIGYGVYYDARTALTSAAAVAFFATCGISIHAAMLLNSGGMLNPADVFVGTATSSDVRTMTSQVSTVLGELHIARQLEAKPVIETISVASIYADPVAWYLRDFPQLRVVSSIGDAPAVAIVASQTKAPSGPYVGETFQLFTSSARPGLSPIELGKWLLYRQAPSAGDTYIKVFVKTQLGRR
jgi:predicted membrane-bound mannosyltransferase